MDLFDYNSDGKLAPLAERMRPTSIEEFIGQRHIVSGGSLLSRAVLADKLGSCIFYGPPGCGKSTLASIIAHTTKGECAQLNAVTSGVADAKRVIEEAANKLKMYGKHTYLLLDECHRWNKAQSDCVLSAIEKGYIIFIGSTTENPFANMTRAIVSRCRVFEFRRLGEEDIILGLNRAVDSPNGLKNMNVVLTDNAARHYARVSNGDMRAALNALELAALSTPPDDKGNITVDIKVAEESIQTKALSIDDSLFYDMLSAFCKSLRGSDPDAALFWSERLISAGCDPMIIARRLVAHSAEDVGMADPQAMPIAVAAMTALEKMGVPEGRIPLAEAIIYVCEAAKSNSVVIALDGAREAAQSRDDTVPQYLSCTSYKAEKPTGYKYPHSYGGYVEQQYLPDDLKNAEFYIPLGNGREKGYVKRKKKLKD